MKKVLIAILVTSMILIMTGCASTGASGGSFPGRQIEIVVPYTAGGAADLTARAFSPAFEESVGGTAVVINKAGASGVVGFSFIASAKADGYTIGLVPLPSVCINSVLGEFDTHPIDGYDFLGGVCQDPVALSVSADSPFDTLSDLIDYAKKHPGEVSVAASGMTSMDTVVCRDLEAAAGIEFNIVDYVGGAESLTAVMGGHADIMGGTVGEMSAYADAGQLKILAAGEEGYGYPTFEEEGYPITLTKQIRCILAPKGLDEPTKTLLIDAVKAAVTGEKFKDNLQAMNLEPCYITPEEMEEYALQIMTTLEKFK